MDNRLTGCLQKEHSEVDRAWLLHHRGKVIALRPVCCAKSETVQKGVRTGGAGTEASNCRFKDRTKFLLIAATLARRVCFPSLRALIPKGWDCVTQKAYGHSLLCEGLSGKSRR